MTTIIDGKAYAERLRKSIAGDVSRFTQITRGKPGLAVILVGDNPASEIYVRNKVLQTTEAGMQSFDYRLPQHTSQSELISQIEQLNRRSDVHGILVQLPLPSHIDPEAIIDTIDPVKDVDGFHVINAGRLVTGGTAHVPCTPMGCLMLLREHLPELDGKKALVIGRSNIVGKPMATLLVQANCTVTIAHSRTLELADECSRADIVIAAVGRPKYVQGEWIKPGAVVIDVGINRIEEQNGRGRLVGDVDFDSAVRVAGAITPVPGGVGPMTIACLLQNTLNAAQIIAGTKQALHYS
ncbi:MAG: bifunctional methylenetetrahydrofolate dehydrogenase/methenyltetrahydrofolate cyclohydrolase FolD [Proteobacteria bacterium]|nr:MAG: bifunctional methylenetetrahydrofolate dehydrogenase/methenyltetrahydrofolate cyclohydrolase FolD [Pseudomonadota bacterium]QKK12322.1 MAG: bifunctional methylenetetrahydrofolate dehydrogenase/methenyltetrahydrofolate cyclohydrolase FolD [Pseudomonadota bacterium]